MSKNYVIDIPDDAQYILINGAAKNRCYSKVVQIADLKELNRDYINEHFVYMQDEAYLRGFKDGKNQKEDSIEVGDEVVWNDGTTLTVTRVHKLDDDEWCDGMDENGAMYGVLKNNVRKTGRHYDVQSILEAMQDVIER